MNTQKYHINNIGLLKENDRSLYAKEQADGTIVYDSQSRSEIDWSRTYLNYNLCPHQAYTGDEVMEIQKRVRGREMRHDGVLFGSTVITLPKDFTGDSAAFFQSAYEGLKKIYGLTDADIISSYRHLDETSDHMHFDFIPVYHSPENKDTISWEHVMPKAIYNTQHRILQEYMSSELGMPVNILNGQTLGFDVQALTHEQKDTCKKIYEKKAERDNIYTEISDLEYRKFKATKDIDYYSKSGDAGKANEASAEWSRCNERVNILYPRKKAVRKELDALIADLSNAKRPTAQQKQTIDLVVEKEHIEAQCEDLTIQNAEQQYQLSNTQDTLRSTQNALRSLVQTIPAVCTSMLDYWQNTRGKMQVWILTHKADYNSDFAKKQRYYKALKLQKNADAKAEAAQNELDNLSEYSKDIDNYYAVDENTKGIQRIQVAGKAAIAAIAGVESFVAEAVSSEDRDDDEMNL